ncbi:TPA: carbohydrate ABC transporter permease [bacterium]|jgi:multiple sugar transport system permease protein|nr:carbohydrate ABC transporter permease [bacterium]
MYRENKWEKAIRYSVMPLIYILLTIMAAFMLLPFYWMLITSFKTFIEATAPIPIWWINPSTWQWENYELAYNLMIRVGGNIENVPQFMDHVLKRYVNFGDFFFNTVFSTLINTILTLITVILGAFAVARVNFAGKKVIFAIMIATMMVPGEMILITNIVTIYQLNWTDTFEGIIMPFIASVFYTFLLVQLFRQIPDSLYKAARVDGCSDWKFLWRVLVPMSKNTLITIAILDSIGSWNAYLWPYMVNRAPRMYVLSVALYEFTSALTGVTQTPAPQILMAAAAITIAPMILVYLLLRKQIIAGVTRGGTKG